MHTRFSATTCWVLFQTCLFSTCWTSTKASDNKSNDGVLTDSSSKTKTTTSTSETIVRRVKNLDYWDSETLAAYFGLNPQTAAPLENHLETYQGYDAAVMLFAQRCPNCHALAPLWDEIAKLTHAGTTKSNVIMALFDCELNERHMRLCDALGVTHYPTLKFAGAGPFREYNLVQTFKTKSSEDKKKKRPRLARVTTFKGNWQYGNEIMDWIAVCHGLSSWHLFLQNNGLVKFARSVLTWPQQTSFKLLGLATGNKKGLEDDGEEEIDVTSSIGDYLAKKKKKQNKGISSDKSLPVGIPNQQSTKSSSTMPSSSSSSPSSSSESSSSVSEAEYLRLTQLLNETESKRQSMQDAATHGSLLLSHLLLSSSTSSSNTTSNHSSSLPTPNDTFAILTTKHGWNSHNPTTPPTPLTQTQRQTNLILRSCMADLSVDYCKRVTERLVQQHDITSLWNEPNATYAYVMTKLIKLLNTTEPFCVLLDGCVHDGFMDAECQPSQCPFWRGEGCLYVGACLEDDVQREYQGLVEELQLGKNKQKGGGNGGAYVDPRLVKLEEEVRKKEKTENEVVDQVEGGAGGGGMGMPKKKGGWGF